MLNLGDYTFAHHFRGPKPQLKYVLMKLQENGIKKVWSKCTTSPCDKEGTDVSVVNGQPQQI